MVFVCVSVGDGKRTFPRGMPSLGGSWCRGDALVVCVWSFTDDVLVFVVVLFMLVANGHSEWDATTQ